MYSRYALWLLMAVPAFAAEPTTLVVDRGLPQSNLNNLSGAARSNVRWSLETEGFLGDDFTIGAVGEQWVIDSIRTWTVPGVTSADPLHLGEFFQDVRLYFGGIDQDLTPLATAKLSPRTGEPGSPHIRVSEATAAGAQLYDDFGKSMRVWQIDFTNLNAPVDGGTKYRFGVWGLGRPNPATPGKAHEWFNHASDAALSGSRQDGADGAILQFDGAGRYQGELNTQGNGWDKNADINVQVFAHRVLAASAPKQ